MHTIRFLQNAFQDMGMPILAICLGVTAGLMFALKRPSWWMFPLTAVLTGIGIFCLSMPFWLDRHGPAHPVGYALVYLVPTFMIAIVSRAGWARSALAGLVATVVMVGIVALGLLLTR